AGVKIYRVVHNLPAPQELAAGMDPAEKHFYYPYFQGEFTVEGDLKHPDDPYLYWLIPIVKTHDPDAFLRGKLNLNELVDGRDLQIVDLLEKHAQLPSEKSADFKASFVPGLPAEQPSTTAAAAGVPR